jgi:hypothetical protein
VLLPDPARENRAEVKAKIAAMRAQGTTDMASGLRKWLDEVRSHIDPKGINRIVMLGDGDPNDEAPIRPLAQEAGSAGISITALGLGADYNETLMGAIAQLSGGRFRFGEDSTKVAGSRRTDPAAPGRVRQNAVVDHHRARRPHRRRGRADGGADGPAARRHRDVSRTTPGPVVHVREGRRPARRSSSSTR